MANQVFQPQRDGSGNVVFAPQYDGATGGVTGTIAVTEAPDTAALTASNVVLGVLAAEGRSDIVQLTGTATVGGSVSGAIAVTERADVVAIIISPGGAVSGAIAVTERPDSVTLTAVGTAARGSIAVTEQPDNIALTGVGDMSGNQPFLNAFTLAYAASEDKLETIHDRQDARMIALADGLTVPLPPP